MSTTSTSNDFTRFDVRDIPCRIKHGQIIQRWLELPVGQHFVLINDHEPVPLYYQFDATFPGEFTWERIFAGEDEFHIKITRIAPRKNPAAPLPTHSACGSHSHTATPASAAASVNELDLRGMEPPSPMVHILQAIETLTPGKSFVARTDRKPIHLIPELDAHGIQHTSEELADGSWRTTLRRA